MGPRPRLCGVSTPWEWRGWAIINVQILESDLNPGSACTSFVLSKLFKILGLRNSKAGRPVVRTSSSNLWGAGAIPDQGAKIPHASRPKSRNKTETIYCNTFN